MISDWIHSWQHYLWSSNLISMIIEAMKQGVAWWLPASWHYLYWCCLIINEDLWQPPNAQDTNQATVHCGQWVKVKSRASSASANVSTKKSILATIIWISIFIIHWGRVTHICISKLTIIGSDNGLSPGTAPSHYLKQCWNIINWTLRNKCQWNFNRNSYIFIQENVFENVIWTFCLGLYVLKSLHVCPTYICPIYNNFTIYVHISLFIVTFP